MHFIFSGSQLTETDYFGDVAYKRGLAWLCVNDRVWHLLLPRIPKTYFVVQARPDPADDEAGGWQWVLDVDGECFGLPVSQIFGDRPMPPDWGGHLKRVCQIYTCPRQGVGQMAFGGVYDFHSGYSGRSSTLWLTNGIHVGYKPRGLG